MYTLQEVADMLNVSNRTVRNWIKSGKLPALKIVRQYRITKEDLAAFIQDSKRETVSIEKSIQNQEEEKNE